MNHEYINVHFKIFLLALFFILHGTPASQAQPASYQKQLQIGDQLLAANNLKAAKAAFNEAFDIYEGSEARLGMARVEIARGRWKPAIKHLEQTVRSDPENIDVRYTLANAYRESLKGFNYIDPQYTPGNYENTWEKAAAQYDWVLTKDSLYEDIIYQYAVFWQYARKFTQAIDLAHRQILIKPELPIAQTGLVQMFNYLHTNARKQDLEDWIGKHQTGYAHYFRGELWRRAGRFEEAEQLFSELRESSAEIPDQLILLSQARIYFAQEKFEQGQLAIKEAIAGIENEGDASHLFEEFKYIFSLEELDNYGRLQSASEYQEFFHTFWIKRDPMPSRSVNARLSEHYRRFLIAEKDYLYVGLRVWHTNPRRY